MRKLALLAIFGALLAACASEPRPLPEPEEVVETPESLRERARTLRQTIDDYDLQEIAQADYQVGESHFERAEQLYGTDNAASGAAYRQAIESYEKVIETGFSTLIGREETEVQNLKAQADSVNARENAAEKYAGAQEAYTEARSSRQAAEYEQSLEQMRQARELFDEAYVAGALEQARQRRSRVEDLKRTIAQYDLQSLAQSQYDTAEGQRARAEELYGNDDPASSAAFQQAIDSYENVIEVGFSTLIGREETEVRNLIDKASSVKARVAVADQYSAAQQAYDRAVASRRAGRYEQALEQMKEARDLFEKVYATALQKREQAQEALSEARQQLSEVEATAKEIQEAEESGGTP